MMRNKASIFFLLAFLMVLFTRNAASAEPAMKSDTASVNASHSKADWPNPVMDSETYGLLLFDLLEYRFLGNESALNWDIESWRGGDINRIWVKSEGSSSVGTPRSGEADLQVLYGRLVTAFFDAQIGVRYERTFGERQDKSRTSLVLGLQGLSLYVAEIEAALFIGDSGYLAARLSASKDFLFTQKAIAQVRLEASEAAFRSPDFDTGRGPNDLSLGLRLRYEFMREFAPYVGITWDHTYGETTEFQKRAGTPDSLVSAVAGLRMWY